MRDAGPLLTRLHVLTRADCTTRNRAKAARLARAQDDLEARIALLSEQEELARIRPDLDGNEIMQILGVPQGPVVGKAYRHLLELRMEHGPLGAERAAQELLALGRGRRGSDVATGCAARGRLGGRGASNRRRRAGIRPPRRTASDTTCRSPA